MRRRYPVLGNSLFVLFFMVVIASCTSGPSEPDRESTQDSVSTSTLAPAATEPKAYTVEMSQMKFNPAEITVHKGDRISFVNHDMVAHNIVEASGKGWASSMLSPDAAWTLIVEQSADYYCTIHPVMKGKIIVQE